MRAVLVVVLPEVPDEDDALAAQMLAVGQALSIPQVAGGRIIVAIRDRADAILRAAE